MMNDMKAMRFLAVLAIGLMSVMSVKAQGQRMLEFQVMMSMHDTIYKNFIKDGKHKEAIAPLTTLINILDTTTICRDTEMSPEMVKPQRPIIVPSARLMCRHSARYSTACRMRASAIPQNSIAKEFWSI